VNVIIPEPLRCHTDGVADIWVTARTVADALMQLAAEFPDIGPVLVSEEGALRHGVVVCLGDADIRFRGGITAPLGDARSLQIIVPMLV